MWLTLQGTFSASPVIGFVTSLFKLHILNTHLSLSHEAREESVIEIWQYIKELQGPVIFMGDLNAEPEERAIQFVLI